MGLVKRLSLAAKGSKPAPSQPQPSPPSPHHSAAAGPSTSSSSPAALDKPTEDALRALGKYDTTLLVDDSGSMEPMWETELAPALASVVRTAVQYDEVRRRSSLAPPGCTSMRVARS